MARCYSQLHLRTGFASISSFLQSCFRSSLHDGFLQISKKSSYPILRAERVHASQIYRRVKEVYGELCHARCAIFRWCQCYEAGLVNIKDLPNPGQAHIVTNSATISAVDELLRQNRWITTREIAVELSISKGTVHRIIHKKLGYGKVRAQWVPSICQRIIRRREWVFA
ncbi:hypothetical protein AVEN_101436-1 [Araneus ventricosus]|uniref:Mos1 transposase HTH domain-containing protein n=1 Tax=Araneus ventricosus TaxID=182803 RepID=A0A4Y2CWT5_ARAVE|nr:hypothetical protein AVEN_101436-1 [Araneus ventricosus]